MTKNQVSKVVSIYKVLFFPVGGLSIAGIAISLSAPGTCSSQCPGLQSPECGPGPHSPKWWLELQLTHLLSRQQEEEGDKKGSTPFSGYYTEAPSNTFLSLVVNVIIWLGDRGLAKNQCFMIKKQEGGYWAVMSHLCHSGVEGSMTSRTIGPPALT